MLRGRAFIAIVFASILSVAPANAQLIPVGFWQQPSASDACTGSYTWTETTSATPVGWQDVAASADGMKLAVVKAAQNIKTSTDGGATWVERTTSGALPWKGIESSADGSKLFAFTATNRIYRSLDGGATWSLTTAPSNPYVSLAVSADGQRIAAAPYIKDTQNTYYIVTSADGGGTWATQNASGPRVWPDIASSSDGQKIIAASQGYDIGTDGEGYQVFYNTPGYLMLSTDGGVTWLARLVSGELKMWSAVASSADGQILVAAEYGGRIYRSTNGGSAWNYLAGSGTGAWNSLASSADGMVLVASTDGAGVVKTSNDGGATWTTQSSANVSYPTKVAMSADGSKLMVARYDRWLAQGACGATATCALPWGGTISAGATVTAFQSASVACGSSCASETRTCSNGVLSGSFTNQSCSVQSCAASCSLPWGGSIADGAAVTAYQAGSVACGSSCAGQVRTCTNGTLSGSYTNASCSVQSCGGTSGPWTTGSWSACSASCGGGTQSRGVSCSYDTCTGGMPASSQSCNTQACPTSGPWTVGGWSACSASCGGGTQSRSVSCSYDTCTGGMPASSQSCNTQACPTSGPWTVGGWSACSASCGGGTQSRSVSCSYDTCTGGMPASSQSCNTQACPTSGPWTVGGWSACSASCGGGSQTRSVSCSYDTCTGGMPASSQSCNTQSCCVDTSWSPPTSTEGVGCILTQTSNCGRTRDVFGTRPGPCN